MCGNQRGALTCHGGGKPTCSNKDPVQAKITSQVNKHFKKSMRPKVIYRFNGIPIKIPMTFIVEIEKNPKIHIESQGTPNSENNLEREQRSLTLPDFKTFIKLQLSKQRGNGLKTGM